MTNHASVQTSLGIIFSRLEQLRLIADANETSVRELIIDFIESQIEAGVIPDELPGIKISRTDAGVRIIADDFNVEIPHREISALHWILARASVALSNSAVDDAYGEFARKCKSVKSAKVSRAGKFAIRFSDNDNASKSMTLAHREADWVSRKIKKVLTDH